MHSSASKSDTIKSIEQERQCPVIAVHRKSFIGRVWHLSTSGSLLHSAMTLVSLCFLAPKHFIPIFCFKSERRDIHYSNNMVIFCIKKRLRDLLLWGEVWAYKTSLTPPLFIDVPVARLESELSCICVLEVAILPLSNISSVDFGIVPAVWYFFFLFNSPSRRYSSFLLLYGDILYKIGMT